MKTLKYILTAVCITLSGSVMAQNLNSAYFLDGYSYGYELNPAKDYERKGFVGFPLLMLGNTNVSLSGNLSMKDIFYTLPNGKLGTFMHPDISADQALENLKGGQRTNVDMRIDLINFGFHKWGGYNFFNLSMRSNTGFHAPGDLFEMAKTLSNKNYDISDFGIKNTTWMEIGFGHSRNVTESWRVGGTVKVLLGAGRVNMKAKSLKMDLAGPDKWLITAEAEIEASAKGLTWGEYNTDPYNDGTARPDGVIKFGNMDISKAGVGGVGLAFDLGAEWDMEKAGILKGMKLSASLLDLGFISWNNTLRGENVKQSYQFNGFNNIKVKDGEGKSMQSQFDDFTDGMEDLFTFQDKGNDNGARALGATLNIGVQYKLPMYDKLEFGFLSTTRIQGAYSWNEERLSANIHPVKWLEGAINFGFGSLGTSFGWVINIHTKGFSIFAGMDRLLGKFSKQGIPTGSSANASIGISFPFGSLQ